MDVLRESTGSAEGSLTRRQLLRAGGAGAALLAGGGLLEACSSGSGTTATTSPASATSGAKKGGHLTVAVVGGSSSDTLDADAEVSTPDLIRVTALYNGLVTFNTGGTGVVNELAEEMTPNADATAWTIRVRSGVTFHNGKTLGAEDVAYTIRRIADPKAPLNGYSVLSQVDLNNMEILDARTLRIHMKRPLATLPEQLFPSYNYGIVPVGYDPKNPVGTGPFKFKSMTPAQQSVFERNDNYWKPGLPYLDGLTIIDSFGDPQSAFNALQSGKVDVYAEADLTTARQVKNIPSLKSVISAGGQWIPFTMRVDQPPFNDVRVRQAMRLIVNRPQLVDIAFDGYADVGNDIFGQHDPVYNASLHRSQDIPQAKFLLKQAGHENLTVELVTSDIAGGAISCAQVLSQQARAAGVTINLNQVPSSVLLRQGLPALHLRPGLLGLQPVPLPGGAGDLAGFALQRDPLQRPDLHLALQPGERDPRHGEADRHLPRDAADRLQPRRLHHRGLQQDRQPHEHQGERLPERRRRRNPARQLQLGDGVAGVTG